MTRVQSRRTPFSGCLGSSQLSAGCARPEALWSLGDCEIGLKAAKYSLLLFLRPIVAGAALAAQATAACEMWPSVDGCTWSAGHHCRAQVAQMWQLSRKMKLWVPPKGHCALPETAAGKAAGAGARMSILCAVMRLHGVVFPPCKGCT